MSVRDSPTSPDEPPMRRGRVLLTNDDGIESPGLRDLARALADDDHDVLVAAPAEDVSGAGTGIGRYDAADPTRLARADFDGIEAYAIAGPPGLAVMAAALGAFGDRPELVVSGVNAGMNTGRSIIHSGTVGAAITARTFGGHGIAVSLAPGERWQWDTAVEAARNAIAWVSSRGVTTTLNVNVPGVPLDQVRGTRWASMDHFGHFRVARADESGEVLDLEVHDRRAGADPASDTALCLNGYITLTLLTPLGPDDVPDVDPEVVVTPGPVTRDARGA